MLIDVGAAWAYNLSISVRSLIAIGLTSGMTGFSGPCEGAAVDKTLAFRFVLGFWTHPGEDAVVIEE